MKTLDYTVKDHTWDSKEEFERYRDYIIPKLKEVFNHDCSVDWDFCSNWIEVRK